MLGRSRSLALVLFCLATLTGCVTHNLVSLELSEVPDSGSTTATMGDTLMWDMRCPCYEIFVASRRIVMRGRRPIEQESAWVAKYRNAETGGVYLVDPAYHPALALVLHDGLIDPERAMTQISGAKQFRWWALAVADDRNALQRRGYEFRKGWRLQYLGPKDGNLSVLRFSIEDLSPERKGEVIGQVEYVHDLANGREFVIRGYRIRVGEVSPDGTLAFTSTKEGSS